MKWRRFGGGVKVVVFPFSEALFTLCESILVCTRDLPLPASADSSPPPSHSSSLTLCSRRLFFLSFSLASAGSEHFLLGENLTVAVLGVVIPIGKLSCLSSRVKLLSVCLSCAPSPLTLCCQNRGGGPATGLLPTHLPPHSSPILHHVVVLGSTANWTLLK